MFPYFHYVVSWKLRVMLLRIHGQLARRGLEGLVASDRGRVGGILLVVSWRNKWRIFIHIDYPWSGTRFFRELVEIFYGFAMCVFLKGDLDNLEFFWCFYFFLPYSESMFFLVSIFRRVFMDLGRCESDEVRWIRFGNFRMLLILFLVFSSCIRL